MSTGLRIAIWAAPISCLCLLFWVWKGRSSIAAPPVRDAPPSRGYDATAPVAAPTALRSVNPREFRVVAPGSDLTRAVLEPELREKIARFVLTRGRASGLPIGQSEDVLLLSSREAYLYLRDNVSFVGGSFEQYVEDDSNYYFGVTSSFTSGIAVQKVGGMFVSWRTKDIEAMSAVGAGGWRAIPSSLTAAKRFRLQFNAEERLEFSTDEGRMPVATPDAALGRLWERLGDEQLHQFYTEDEAFYYFFGGTATALERSYSKRARSLDSNEGWVVDRRTGAVARWAF